MTATQDLVANGTTGGSHRIMWLPVAAVLFAGRLLAGASSGAAFGAGTAWLREVSRPPWGTASDPVAALRAAIAMTTGFALGTPGGGAAGAVGGGAHPGALSAPYRADGHRLGAASEGPRDGRRPHPSGHAAGTARAAQHTLPPRGGTHGAVGVRRPSNRLRAAAEHRGRRARSRRHRAERHDHRALRPGGSPDPATGTPPGRQRPREPCRGYRPAGTGRRPGARRRHGVGTSCLAAHTLRDRARQRLRLVPGRRTRRGSAPGRP